MEDVKNVEFFGIGKTWYARIVTYHLNQRNIKWFITRGEKMNEKKVKVMRNPPKDKLLHEKYWKRHDDGREYKLRPIAFRLCPNCKLYYPVFLHGQTPKLCYRCHEQSRKRHIKSIRISSDNLDYISNNVSNLSNFVNKLIEKYRKMEEEVSQ